MRLLILVLFLPAFSWAADCKLETPVKLTHEIDYVDIKLKNILLSEVPKFSLPEHYNPFTDTLDLDIHALSAPGHVRSRYIGVTLVAPRTGAWMGFAYNYSNADKFEGSLQQVDDILAIHSLEVGDTTGKITETYLTVEDDAITSILLTYPVYKFVDGKKEFTGENQSVCVLSVERVLGL